jgi:hypothetical protein
VLARFTLSWGLTRPGTTNGVSDTVFPRSSLAAHEIQFSNIPWTDI